MAERVETVTITVPVGIVVDGGLVLIGETAWNVDVSTVLKYDDERRTVYLQMEASVDGG